MSSPVTARIVVTAAPADPQGLVLVLHGGAARTSAPRVRRSQLSVLRMVPVATRIARASRGRLVVQRLLNSSRGWNPRRTPVDDVEWALARARTEFGADLPTCLVGHSLGARAALHAGSLDQVSSVVALAPWLAPGEQLRLADRQVLFVHGDADRIAPPSRSVALARQLEPANDVGYVTITGGGHALLGHRRLADRLAADFAVATLLPDPVGGLLARIRSGEAWLQV